jgi:hypothetical protein
MSFSTQAEANQQTINAARRLLKSRLRLVIYSVKGESWESLALLEKGITQDSQEAWAQVLASWDLTDHRLTELIIEAYDQARQDVVSFFADTLPIEWIKKQLQDYDFHIDTILEP